MRLDEAFRQLRRRLLARRVRRALGRRGVDLSEAAIERRIVVHELRGHFEALGHDTGNLSDEEIGQGVARFCREIGRAGLTMAEAANTISRIMAAAPMN